MSQHPPLPPVAVAASHQQVAELHEVEHVALVHLGQLLAELDGLLPHLRRSRGAGGAEEQEGELQWSEGGASLDWTITNEAFSLCGNSLLVW